MDKPRLKHSLIVVTYGIVLFLILTNLPSLHAAGLVLRRIVMPFIYGLSIAYLLNIPYRGFRDHLFAPLARKGKTAAAVVKYLSIILSYLTVIAILVILIWIIIPQLVISLTLLVQNIPYYIQAAENLISRIGKYFGQENFYEGQLDSVWPSLIRWGNSLMDNVVSNFVDYVSTVTSRIYGWIIGVAFSVYLLAGKERLLVQTTRVIRAYLAPRHADRLMTVARRANRTFTNFIAGDLFDSLLVGAICFVGLSLLGMPYPLLISVIVGVTNLIPIVGPFIGAIPGALIILTVEPIKALIFVLFILVLQQIDGNVFKPRIFGNRIGLPSIWVLLAIVVLGGLFGIPGMLLGVPVFAILYSVLREQVAARLARRGLTDEQAGTRPPDSELAGTGGVGSVEVPLDKVSGIDQEIDQKPPV